MFTQAWGIPDYEENVRVDKSLTDTLQKNALYKKMMDVEIVLRFFAFKAPSRISGSVRSMLDNTMKSNKDSDEHKLEHFRKEFLDAIQLCVRVFGDDVFRIPSGESGTKSRLSRPFFDAQMVGMYKFRDRSDSIISNAATIKEKVLGLAAPESESYELIVGRANTAIAVRNRIKAVRTVISGVIL